MNLCVMSYVCVCMSLILIRCMKMKFIFYIFASVMNVCFVRGLMVVMKFAKIKKKAASKQTNIEECKRKKLGGGWDVCLYK